MKGGCAKRKSYVLRSIRSLNSVFLKDCTTTALVGYSGFVQVVRIHSSGAAIIVFLALIRVYVDDLNKHAALFRQNYPKIRDHIFTLILSSTKSRGFAHTI